MKRPGLVSASDTLLALGISLGVMAASLQSWSDLRATQQTALALEQFLHTDRGLEGLLQHLDLADDLSDVHRIPP